MFHLKKKTFFSSELLSKASKTNYGALEFGHTTWAVEGVQNLREV